MENRYRWADWGPEYGWKQRYFLFNRAGQVSVAGGHVAIRQDKDSKWWITSGYHRSDREPKLIGGPIANEAHARAAVEMLIHVQQEGE